MCYNLKKMRINKIQKYYIYCLYGSKDQEIRYVGVTYRPNRRLKDHIQNSKKLITHRDKWLQKIITEGQNVEICIIDECYSSEVSSYERFWIAHFRATGCSLTNHTDGGEGLFNPTEETVKKLSLWQKGKKRSPLSEEHKNKLKVARAKRTYSRESCLKISKAKKGMSFTEEHKHKLRDAKLGKKNPNYPKNRKSRNQRLRLI